MYPAPGGTDLGNFIAWDASEGKIVWSNPEPFSVWSGALATAGDVVFYGTLEGYLKAVDANTGRELYRFKTPSGIIGNVNTWMHKGQQYVGVLSGVGGWAGIGLAAGLIQEDNAAAWHGAVDQGREAGDADKSSTPPAWAPSVPTSRCQQLHPARRSADRLQAGQLSSRLGSRETRAWRRWRQALSFCWNSL